MIIGGQDKSILKAKGTKVVELENLSDDYFMIEVDSIALNGKHLADGVYAILDTGNTMISIPNTYETKFAAILTEISEHCDLYDEDNVQFEQVGCAFDKKLTNDFSFDFILKGVKFSIPASSLVDQCKDSDSGASMMDCLIGIEFQKNGKNFILGKNLKSLDYLAFSCKESRNCTQMG